MLQVLRGFVLLAFVRPFARFVLGVDVIGREKLPLKGPAILVANHNSHLDTLLLLSLYPPHILPKVRPVAAADHFLRSPLSTFFSMQVVGIIPVKRKGAEAGEDVLAECREALERGDILVIFPEGSRGEPEEIGQFKAGVARLAKAFPSAPVTPIYLQGAGRSLPRDSKLFVPYTCTAVVGDPLHFEGDKGAFMHKLREAVEALKAQAPPMHWK